MKPHTIFGLVSVAVLSICSAAHSQDIPFPNAGIDPVGSYAGKDVYQIDLSMGQLSAQIPIMSYKQLGALDPINYFITVSNPTFTQQVTCDPDLDACFMYFAAANQGINPYGAQLQMTTDSGRLVPSYKTLASLFQLDSGNILGGYTYAWTDEMQYSAVDGSGHAHQLLHDPDNWNRMYAADGTGLRFNAPPSENMVDLGTPLWNNSGWPQGIAAGPNGVTSTVSGNPANSASFPTTTITDLSGNSYTTNNLGEAYPFNSPPPPFTDALRRQPLPVPFAIDGFPDASNVSHCPTSPGGALYSTSMAFPGYGTVWLCYTRVNYHTGLLTESRPYDPFDAYGAAIPDVYEWPMFEEQLGLFFADNEIAPTDPAWNDGQLFEYQLNTVGTYDALQAIVLPDGRAWTFAYDNSVSSSSGTSLSYCGGGEPGQDFTYATTFSCGGITRIGYPDGGSVQFAPSDFWTGIGYMSNGPSADPTLASTVFVTVGAETRYDGTKTVASNTYTPSAATGGFLNILPITTGTITDVVDTIANTTTRHTFSDLGANGLLAQLYETQSDTYQGGVSGTPLKTVKTSYQFSYMPPVTESEYNGTAINILPQSKSVFLNGVLQTTTRFTYPLISNVTRILCSHGPNNWSACGSSGSYPMYRSTPDREDIYDGQGNLLKSNVSMPFYLTDSTGMYALDNLLNIPAYTEVLDGGGNVASITSYGYDEPNGSPSGIHGNQTSVSTAGITSQTVYNNSGMPQATIDPLGTTTTTSYQCNGGYPQYVTVASGTPVAETTAYGYDCTSGRLASVQGPNDLAQGRPGTAYSYDSIGSLTGIDYPDGGHLGVNYNGYAVPSTVTLTTKASPNPDQVRTLIYDGFGRTVQQQIATGSSTIYAGTVAFDSAGRVGASWNPSACNPLTASSCSGETTWGVTSYQYDALGRTVLQCNPDNGNNFPCQPGNSYKQWSYNGTSTTMKDEVFNTSTQVSDVLGRLTQVLEPGSLSTTYGYDILGNLTNVTQAGNGTETLWANNPETGVVCYGHGNGTTAGCQADGYDADGNLRYKTDARGITTSYSYDALNRLTARNYSDGVTPTDLFEYDQPTNWGEQCATPTYVFPCNNIGHLTHIFTSDFQAQTTLGYDPMGRVNLKTTCIVAQCGTDQVGQHYQYDLAGNQISSEYGYLVDRQVPLGGEAYSYDSGGRMNVVTNINDTVYTYDPPSVNNLLWAATTFDPVGATNSYAVSGGVPYTEAMQHDTRLRTKSYAVTSSGPVYNWGLTFTPNGNVLSNNDSVNGNWTQYTYDGMNRLTSGTSANRAAQWSYDSFGNMLSQTVTAGSGLQFQHSFPQPNNQPYGYPFDAAGNQLGVQGSNELTYNGAGRLASSNFGQTTYEYSGDGTRMAKYSNGVLQEAYIYDLQGRVVTTLDSNYHAIRREAYAGSRHLGTFAGETPVVGSTANNGAPLVLAFADGVGTERARADASGALCQATASLPFGDSTQINGSCSPIPTTFFTGKERDQESGLDYFGARYYASSMGRFTSPDWSAQAEPVPYAKLGNPQSLNLYAYVYNNPLSGIDPDGHMGCMGSTKGFCNPDVQQAIQNGEDPAAAYVEWLDYNEQIRQQNEKAAQQQNNPVATAEGYLSKSKAMRPVLKAFKSGHFHLSLINDGNDRYDPATRTVYWDPNSALETTDGGHQTPALGLGHEMAHATGNRHMTAELSGMADPQYDTREERRVILNYEDPAARQLGESTRHDHGGNPYNVASPTSIIPLPQ